MNLDRLFRIHDRFFGLFAYLTSLLLLLLRWHWGSSFMGVGAGKLENPEKFVPMFADLGIPLPEWNVLLVGSFEYWGGLLLLIGLFSRIISIPLVIIMLTAMFTAHWGGLMEAFPSINPLEWSSGALARQGPFHYMIALFFILILGPGKFSLDWVIRKALRK